MSEHDAKGADAQADRGLKGVSPFDESLPLGASVLAEPHEGWKCVCIECEHLPYGMVGLARIIMPRCAVVYRPSGQGIASVDLRADECAVAEITTLSGLPRTHGCAPHYSFEYQAGQRYTAYDIDYKTDKPCEPGFHFYTTRERAIIHAITHMNFIACLACKLKPVADMNSGLMVACALGHVAAARAAIVGGATIYEDAVAMVRGSGNRALIELLEGRR